MRTVAVTTTHRTSTWILVGLEALIALNAVYGGIGLMVDGLGMPVSWLDGTPFGSWLLPGAFLLLVIAVPMTVAAIAELQRADLAYLLSLAAGVAQVGWIAVQVAILQRFFFLQPVLLVAGVVVVGLTWWSHRDRFANGARWLGRR